MPSPNPEEYARQMLWHLCGVEAHLYQVQHQMIADFSLRLKGDPAKSVELLVEQWKTKKEEMQQYLFERAAKQAGLSLQAQSPPPPDESPPFSPPNQR